ncbi:MAG: mannose-1-phosphate guanylyltransferase, partial [Muribaculaceae bacterium]|nr:mannose-1-phosphate guanylyltransferase [Muribaculaceae bacterium]
YIQVGSHTESENINRVKTFTEKPDLSLAEVFLQSGEFFWNSGIFMWKVQTIMDALRRHAPDISAVFDRGCESFGTGIENEFIRENFPGCMGISIDFAVMEKARNVYVETVGFGWNDLGTWSSLYDNSPRNKSGNVAQNCHLLTYDSTGNIFAVKDDKLVVVDGLKDYIVADAGDVLLICRKSEEQRIKQMVNDARVNFGETYL